MAVSTAGAAPPAVLARTLGVCGRLGCDQMVLDSLARHLITGVDKLQPEQMQQLVRKYLSGVQCPHGCALALYCLTCLKDSILTVERT